MNCTQDTDQIARPKNMQHSMEDNSMHCIWAVAQMQERTVIWNVLECTAATGAKWTIAMFGCNASSAMEVPIPRLGVPIPRWNGVTRHLSSTQALSYISACMGRVRPSIPALITLQWGLCASHLRARRGRRPKKEIGFPPRNLTISNSHNRLSILTQSRQPVCVISYFTVWIKRSGFTSLTTYIF